MFTVVCNKCNTYQNISINVTQSKQQIICDTKAFHTVDQCVMVMCQQHAHAHAHAHARAHARACARAHTHNGHVATDNVHAITTC